MKATLLLFPGWFVGCFSFLLGCCFRLEQWYPVSQGTWSRRKLSYLFLKNEMFIWRKRDPVRCCLDAIESDLLMKEIRHLFVYFVSSPTNSVTGQLFTVFVKQPSQYEETFPVCSFSWKKYSNLSLLLSQSSRKFLVWGSLPKLSNNLPRAQLELVFSAQLRIKYLVFTNSL